MSRSQDHCGQQLCATFGWLLPAATFIRDFFGQQKGQSVTPVATSRVGNCFWPALPITTPSADQQHRSGNCSSSSIATATAAASKSQQQHQLPIYGCIAVSGQFAASFWQPKKVKNRLLSALFMFDCWRVKGLGSIGLVLGTLFGFRKTHCV